jgi:uncharacterized iron-regulated protein
MKGPICLAAGLALLTGAACEGTSTMPGGGEPAGMEPAPMGYLGNLPTTGKPYRLVRGRGASAGAAMATKELAAELADADAVCLGETHDNANDHAAQLLVLEQLVGQASAAGRRLATGLEMFQLPVQPVLDDYSAGRIDEATLLARTDWVRSWRHDFAFYRPLLERTVGARGTIRALNVRETLAQKIGRMGLASLTPEERAELPEMDLDDAAHRAWFERSVAGVTAHGPNAAANLYAAQVARDETMAETATQWLRSQEPAPRQIAIVAGNGHCMDLAIPARLRRRGARKVLIVRPVLDADAEIATALTDAYSDILVVYGR